MKIPAPCLLSPAPSTLAQFPLALSHQPALTPAEIARVLEEYADGTRLVGRRQFDRRWPRLKRDLAKVWEEHRKIYENHPSH